MNYILKYNILTGEDLQGKILSDELDSSLLEEQALKLARLEFFAKRVPIIIQRKGSATFEKVSLYQPTIPANTAFPLEFDGIAKESEDIRIFKDAGSKGFKVGINGTYQINVSWCIAIPAPAAMNFVQLDLYKNGILHRQLDKQPIKSVLALGGDALHKFDTIQGSKLIDLKIDDVFDIRLTHDKAAGFATDETHTGYLDIVLITTNN